MAQARFEPAADQRGRPVAGTYSRSVKWVTAQIEPWPVTDSSERAVLWVDAAGIVTDGAFEALAEVVEALSDPIRSIGEVERASESGKNFVRRILRELWEYKKTLGVAAISIPPILYGLGRWALANELIIRGYFASTSTAGGLLAQLFEWLHKLPLM